MIKTLWVFLGFIAAGLLMFGLVSYAQTGQFDLQPGTAAVLAPPVNQTVSSPATTPTAVPTGTVIAPAPTAVNTIPLPAAISGVISDVKGPVAGAIVQIHGSPNKTTTAKDGTYKLSGLSGTTPIVLTAWSEGNYVGSVTVNPSAPDWKGANAVNIPLKQLPANDNNHYGWFTYNGVHGSASCALCHRESKEWNADAHSQSAQNKRFLTIYTGEDVLGHQGQTAQWGTNGGLLPPDPAKPYYGPGYQLDNPGRAGNCAACHTPMASQSPNQQNCAWSGCHTSVTIEHSNGVIAQPATPLSQNPDAAEGISCEFCHKVGDVILDPKTKLPLPDMPGILSMKLYRPVEGQQIFFGTLVDVNRRVANSPLESESKFCASCHYGISGGVMGSGDVKDGTLIYNSYGEWLNSPYSDAKSGKTCQQCHMPVSSAKWFVFPDKGGLTRDYAELHNHTMPGVTDEKLMQNAVTLTSTAQREGDQISVKVSITNDRTGHDVPTDSPIRSMILVVEAVDANGKTLALKQGPVNPAYSGNYGGLPGKTFAKILKDQWTGETPTAAQWRPVSIVSDNRLAPLATDNSQYSFTAPASGDVTLKVHLVYRRAFQQLEQQKGWNDPDLVMAEKTLTLGVQ